MKREKTLNKRNEEGHKEKDEKKEREDKRES